MIPGLHTAEEVLIVIQEGGIIELPHVHVSYLIYKLINL